MWDLWVANADGTNPRKLFSDGNVNSNPVWAANGEVFFYKTAPFHNGFQVCTIHVDGSGLTWVAPGQVGMAEMPSPVQ